MTHRLSLGLWLSIALCAGLCLYSMSFRHRAESLNKAVSIAAEAETIEALGAAQGLNVEESMARMAKAGLKAVVLSEQTVGELLSHGELSFEVGALPKSQTPVVHIGGEVEVIARVERGLRIRFGLDPDKMQITPSAPGVNPPIRLTVFNISPELLRSVTIGLPPHYAEAAAINGLDVIARHGNPSGVRESAVGETIKWSSEQGARYFLPMGDSVLGRKDSMDALYKALDDYQFIYCSPEFAKIGGDSNVLVKKPERVVRLHSAQAVELDKLTLGGAIERYSKAAIERSIRQLLVRPVTSAAPMPLNAFAEFISKLGKQIVKEGGALMSAHPFEDSGVPQWLFAAIGLSIAPAAVFTVFQFTRSHRLTWAMGVLAALIGFGCWLDAARPFAALLGALVFPCLAFMLQPNLPKKLLVQLLVISAVSLVGGLCVAGLLNGLPFFIRADQFSGVKLAHFAPLAAIGIYFFLTLTDARSAYRSPILWSQAVIGMVLLVAMAFMAARTGNDSPAGVSGVELQIRSLLEQWLVVRPRTKEFIIGHPLMVVGLGMLILCQTNAAFRQKFGGWTALAVMVGAIGQTSMVNTLCHLHTPLTIGLMRIAIGLIIGTVIGLIIWQVIRPSLLKQVSSGAEGNNP